MGDLERAKRKLEFNIKEDDAVLLTDKLVQQMKKPKLNENKVYDLKGPSKIIRQICFNGDTVLTYESAGHAYLHNLATENLPTNNSIDSLKLDIGRPNTSYQSLWHNATFLARSQSGNIISPTYDNQLKVFNKKGDLISALDLPER